MKNVSHAALALRNRPRSRTGPRPKDRVGLKPQSIDYLWIQKLQQKRSVWCHFKADQQDSLSCMQILSSIWKTKVQAKKSESFSTVGTLMQSTILESRHLSFECNIVIKIKSPSITSKRCLTNFELCIGKCHFQAIQSHVVARKLLATYVHTCQIPYFMSLTNQSGIGVMRRSTWFDSIHDSIDIFYLYTYSSCTRPTSSTYPILWS